jgi:DNA repair protein RadC
MKTLYSDRLIERALKCLEKRLCYGSVLLDSASAARAYLQLQLAEEKNEVFAVLFLNNSHRLLAFEKMFRGTVNETAVYPRQIVQKVLEHNASAILIAHNHPSGDCSPSVADREITLKLQTIFDTIDVKVLDHFIVSCPNSYSFAEHGLL